MPSIPKAQIRKNFRDQLEAAITTGHFPYTDEGLNGETIYALMKVAKSYPNATEDEIASAKDIFNRQMTVPVDLNAAAARYAAG